MFAVTGVTGRVGGALARALLSRGHPVRAVLRDPRKADAWVQAGCAISFADIENESQLARSFEGAEGVFILPPPIFDPQPGYPEARRVIDAVVEALQRTRPAKVVCLSTIGADAKEDNLLTQRTLMETALGELDLPVSFLRPAWFMENAAWDLASARDEGVVHSFLQPADRRIAMVASADVGEVAADLLLSQWQGRRVTQLEGPDRASPADVAAALAAALRQPVRVNIVPREQWEQLFRAQGMNNPTPRMRMIDGFNEGWIDFHDGRVIKGRTTLWQVMAELVAGKAQHWAARPQTG
jgi:uncharacterized protein YbjT (DUF2867 family)